MDLINKMSKQPVNPNWFLELRTEKPQWLSQLSAFVKIIVIVGCYSDEPFALMWTLDAAEVTVIEKKEIYLSEPMGPQEKEELLRRDAAAFQGRSIEFITADISKKIDGLASNYFDLAYCKYVLYQMESNQEIQNTINQMTRVVKPGGWVIAVEPIISFPDMKPLDMSLFFEAVGLDRVDLDDAPSGAYCYKKRFS